MRDNKYYGIYQGVVSSIKDTEKRGRIKIKCPDVLGETESAWCDPVVPVAYDGGGDFCMPALNETVWVMFIDGDANRPVWLGNWWQEDMTPLGKNYNNIDKVRIISFEDCSIIMKKGEIDFKVGAGEWDFQIKDGKVNMKELGSEQVNDLDKRISSLEKKVSSLESTISSLESNVDGFQSTIDSLNTSIENINSKITSLESSINSMSSSISGLETRVTQLESK